MIVIAFHSCSCHKAMYVSRVDRNDKHVRPHLRDIYFLKKINKISQLCPYLSIVRLEL